MDILNYVVQEGLVMIPVLFIIGEIIKGTELLGNKWIPLVLLVVSIGFTPLVLGAYTADNIVQAVLVAGVTVFGNELVKQSSKGDVN
ncbi:phage holin family protein [Aerococcus urinaeequi]|uniref:Phage holin family protein n=1 Tax=Aerococcus urinaeequi TaxID=51665 RepID=A0AAE9XKM8_9LACT|nr:phage holin family protein [Aerococcus urinaeequi]WCG38426.1 phage holin family protein [Aerococcus urinaeequi]